MNGGIQALTALLPVLYLVATVLHGMAFAGEKAPPVGRARVLILWGTLVVHAGLFVMHAAGAGGFPVLGTWLIVSGVAWTVALLWASVTLRSPQPSAGAFVLSVVALLQLAASAFGPTAAVASAGEPDAGKLVHVTTSLVAAAALVLSGLYGWLHLVLYRQMREKRFGPIFRELPDLELLSRTTRRAALVGFLFLTAGLNVGIAIAHAKDVSGFDYLDPQVLLTLALWIHFGVIAFSRLIRGLTARRASLAALFGLVTLIVTLLVTLIPGASFHGPR